jgi:hypothetical protein
MHSERLVMELKILIVSVSYPSEVDEHTFGFNKVWSQHMHALVPSHGALELRSCLSSR